MQVRKRDGRIVNFDRERIFEAMKKAFLEVQGRVHPETLAELTSIVEEQFYLTQKEEQLSREIIDIEAIQDEVEKVLIKCGYLDVATVIQNREDTELLDFLQAQTDKAAYTGGVVCRQSSSGRGWKLHETSEDDAVKDVRQAIRKYMVEVLSLTLALEDKPTEVEENKPWVEENKPWVEELEELEAILDGPAMPIQTMPDGSIQTKCKFEKEEVAKPVVKEFKELLDDIEENNFEKELRHLINRHSKENGSNTPDFILAAYLSDCLKAFNHATAKRSYWHNDI